MALLLASLTAGLILIAMGVVDRPWTTQAEREACIAHHNAIDTFSLQPGGDREAALRQVDRETEALRALNKAANRTDNRTLMENARTARINFSDFLSSRRSGTEGNPAVQEVVEQTLFDETWQALRRYAAECDALGVEPGEIAEPTP